METVNTAYADTQAADASEERTTSDSVDRLGELLTEKMTVRTRNGRTETVNLELASSAFSSLKKMSVEHSDPDIRSYAQRKLQEKTTYFGRIRLWVYRNLGF